MSIPESRWESGDRRRGGRCQPKPARDAPGAQVAADPAPVRMLIGATAEGRNPRGRLRSTRPRARAGGRSGPPERGLASAGRGLRGRQSRRAPGWGWRAGAWGRNSHGKWRWRRRRQLRRRRRPGVRAAAAGRGAGRDGAEEVGVPGAPAGLGEGRSAQKVGAVGRPQGYLLL